ncbi:FtsX-like permease family protein [Gaiella sp.]|uniref:FtsX-like permease family protein n=1 Tax=Gaiella sp. TaxID=2663207 RepID=UPI002E3150F8|nr:FtsX-like permease family protein [Gaiella sp.]HEX5582557.1 FtsX-like permease family protein [Gaiella sp.]
MRGAGYVLGLSLHRLRRRESGALVAALGITAAAAVLALILAGTTVAKDRALAQDVDRLPAPSRAVRAVWFGVPAGPEDGWPGLDHRARAALAPLPAGDPTSIVLVREGTVGGRFVGLAAVDGLAPYVELRSGRLPKRCTRTRCEVLRLRGKGRLPDVPGLRVVQVGTAVLRSQQLFGDFLTPSDNALADAEVAPALQRSSRYHKPAPAPLVVAEGVAGLLSSPVLSRTYRSYAWVQPLSAGTPRLWQVDDLLAKADRARAELQTSASAWSLTIPTEELRASEHDATVSGRRLLLVGGEAAALLVAFAVLAAGALRRDLAAARRRLTWHGAQAWQRALLTGAESAAVGFGGAIVGWLIGIGAGAVVAAAAGAPVADVLTESVLSPMGLLLGLGVGILAACVIAATVSIEGRGGRRVSAVDVAAVAALIAVIAVLASGAVDPDELASGGVAAATLLVLPGLVAFAAAVAAARLLPATGRMLARGVGGRSTRLAGVSLARTTGAAGTAAAFLALALALACLAEAYRSTLAAGERDQAAYEVPADVVVREDLASLVPVLAAAPLGRYETIPGVESVHPVVRVTANAGPSASVSGVTVLGVPPQALSSMPLWRSDWGVSRSTLVETVQRRGAVGLRGPILDGRTLVLTAGPGLVSFQAIVKGRDGSVTKIEIGDSNAHRATVLRATIPERARGGRLLELAIVPPRILERGSDEGTALLGTTTLHLEGASLEGWLGAGGVTTTDARDGTIRVRYAITPQRQALIRPRQPTDDDPPRVAVTPALGALAGGVGGTLPLRIDGEPVKVRVGAIVDRIPGTAGDAVVADLDTLQTAIDTSSPGAAPIAELWLETAPGAAESVAATLDRRPFAALDVESRSRLEADARRDPLGHGTLLALAAAAVAALALAVWGLVLALRADLRDDRGDLVDLEAQGATPRMLRRVVAARAGVVASMGILAGVAAGAVLAVLVTRVVSVTARAEQPQPPLVTTVDPVTLAIGCAAFAAAAVALVLLTTRRAFSDPRGPGRIGAEP